MENQIINNQAQRQPVRVNIIPDIVKEWEMQGRILDSMGDLAYDLV